MTWTAGRMHCSFSAEPIEGHHPPHVWRYTKDGRTSHFNCIGSGEPPIVSDEVRITSETGGQKGKKLAQISTVDPLALRTLAEVSGKGAEKYAAHNYLRGYDWSLSYDAAQRHLMAFWSGEDVDPESGQPHVAHAAWHCLAMLSFSQRRIGTDDRPKLEDPMDTLTSLFPSAFGIGQR